MEMSQEGLAFDSWFPFSLEFRASSGHSSGEFFSRMENYPLGNEEIHIPPKGGLRKIIDSNPCPLEWDMLCVPGSINSHYFHIIADGHQPKSVGVYTHIKSGFLSKVGGLPSPKKRDNLDHGTCDVVKLQRVFF